jgi:hypothetical protein
MIHYQFHDITSIMCTRLYTLAMLLDQTLSTSVQQTFFLDFLSSSRTSLMAPFVPFIQRIPAEKAPDQVADGAQTPPYLGDGFTLNETRDNPRSQPWIPPGLYEDLDIKSLVPGPRPVLFMGRIINLLEQLTPSKKANAAIGFMKLIVKDDTGAIMVSIAP